jgi:hypothetical protein
MTYKSEVKSDKSYGLCKDDPTFIENGKRLWSRGIQEQRIVTITV